MDNREMLDRQMKEIVAIIAEDLDAENSLREKEDIRVPEEFHNKMLAFVRELDEKRKKEAKRKARKKRLRWAAVFLVCFIGLNGVAMGTSEAYRQKVYSLLPVNDSKGVILRGENEYDLIGAWKDYWYPSWLPEGYTLIDAAEYEDEKAMLFISDAESTELRIMEFPLDGRFTFDNETLKHEEIQIGNYKGWLFYEEDMVTAIWMTDDRTMRITLTYSSDKQIVLKIAENLEYIK